MKAKSIGERAGGKSLREVVRGGLTAAGWEGRTSGVGNSEWAEDKSAQPTRLASEVHHGTRPAAAQDARLLLIGRVRDE